MPYLIPLARSLSHSCAHQYDGDANGATASSSLHRGNADAVTAGGDQLLSLNDESADVDVDGNGGGDSNTSTAASVGAAIDQHRLLSMQYSFENA